MPQIDEKLGEFMKTMEGVINQKLTLFREEIKKELEVKLETKKIPEDKKELLTFAIGNPLSIEQNNLMRQEISLILQKYGIKVLTAWDKDKL